MQESRSSLQAPPRVTDMDATQFALPTYSEAIEGLPTYAHATDLRTLMRYKPQKRGFFRRADHGRHVRNLRAFLWYIMSKDYGVPYTDQTNFFHIAWCFRAHSAAIRRNIPPSAEATRSIQELIYGPSAALDIPIPAVRWTLERYIDSSQGESGGYGGCLHNLATTEIPEKICVDLNLVLPAICADHAEHYLFLKALDRALERYFSSLPASMQPAAAWASNLRSLLKDHREKVALAWKRGQEHAQNGEKNKGMRKCTCRRGRREGEDQAQPGLEQPSVRMSRFGFSSIRE